MTQEWSMNQAENISLDTAVGRRTGLRWRRESAPRVLCLHGWLDNAASFIPLAPLLGKLDIFALDFPGHGRSDHRHPTARYHFVDYLWDVEAALNALQWQECHLIGHSMGAAVAAVYCAGAPERIRSMVMLDTLGPISVTAESSTDRLRRSLFRSRMEKQPPRQYSSIDDMVAARRRYSDLSEAGARLICDRSAHKVADHYEWTNDPALNWISSLVMTNEQALNFLQNIEPPVLSMIATHEAPWSSSAKLEERRRIIAHGRHETITGHHHFHMDEPEKIAETIESYILANDGPTESREKHEQTHKS
jgi:pimeloyl-ACP methyl ester carboxylesterase